MATTFQGASEEASADSSQPQLQPTERVRVDEEQPDVPDAPAVVAPRHTEEVELVAAALDTDVVIPERPGDEQPVGSGPAEGAEPVRPERGRPLGVVVVAERHERAGRAPGGEPLDGGAGEPLPLARRRRNRRSPRSRCRARAPAAAAAAAGRRTTSDVSAASWAIRIQMPEGLAAARSVRPGRAASCRRGARRP